MYRKYTTAILIGNSTNWITFGANTSIMTAGTKNVTVFIEGSQIRNSQIDGPYQASVLLESNITACHEQPSFCAVAKSTFTTSEYNYTQFEFLPEHYFNVDYFY